MFLALAKHLRDDSLGFEDCCFATHLLNCALKALLYAYFVLC